MFSLFRLLVCSHLNARGKVLPSTSQISSRREAVFVLPTNNVASVQWRSVSLVSRQAAGYRLLCVWDDSACMHMRFTPT